MKVTIILFVITIFLCACSDDESVGTDQLICVDPITDYSHPEAIVFQEILDSHRKSGIMGVSVALEDAKGKWSGTSGYADISNNEKVNPCHSFLIASITKVFTAVCIYKQIERGELDMDDPISKFIEASIIDKINNAEDAKIKHLLSHTSGIPDYYTLSFELARHNKPNNYWSQEDMLKYAYNKKASGPVGGSYAYSNTNYLLLGIILEKVSGLTLKQLYRAEIFEPHDLHSGEFLDGHTVPFQLASGYMELLGKGNYIKSDFLYLDELNTADGGIAMNAKDLSSFLNLLFTGKLLSSASIANMTDWFDLPLEWVNNELGHTRNGFGLEYFETDYGPAFGHTGSVDGFLSVALYFPDQDVSLAILMNSVSNSKKERNELLNAFTKAIFNK